MPQHATLRGETTLALDTHDTAPALKPALMGRLGNPLYAASQLTDPRRGSPYDHVQPRAASLITPGTKLFAPPLLGRSAQMRHLLALIERIAPTDSSTLIMGATGTGKELVARTIHQQSARRAAPFIDINCSAIPDSLFEAELFGHQRGSFTGAHETRRGLLEAAAGGTLFLDEVDALSPAAQAKLLRVLQERCLRRVGGRENIPFNVRILSASSRELQPGVGDSTFRADLLFRLRVIPLYVPTLHERGADDIELLLNHFVQKHGPQFGQRPRRFARACRDVLVGYSWPGNVRELENTVQYALIMGAEEELSVQDLPPKMFDGVQAERALSGQVLAKFKHEKLTLAEAERLYILFILDNCGGNQVQAAATLGIDARTLRRKLKLYKTPANPVIVLA